MFMVPCIILYSKNNQQLQLHAVNFIPLLGSLYMFRVFYTPIIRCTIWKTVSTATGTDHSIVSATYSRRGLVLTREPSGGIKLTAYSCICWLFLEYYTYILVVIFMHSYCLYALLCMFCFHRTNWHSPTEVFPSFFLSYWANARVYLAFFKTGHGPHSS